LNESLQTAKFEHLPENLRKEIEVKLTKGARGMQVFIFSLATCSNLTHPRFRWAQLQIARLKNCPTPNDVRNALEGMEAVVRVLIELGADKGVSRKPQRLLGCSGEATKTFRFTPIAKSSGNFWFISTIYLWPSLKRRRISAKPTLRFLNT
jgi:hypothetical protein